MSGHVMFANTIKRDGTEFWKFLGFEDGKKEVRVWTIPRQFAESFRDALTIGLSTNAPDDRASTKGANHV